MTTDKRTERIAQLRIDLYEAERKADILMVANVELSQENAWLRVALGIIANTPAGYITEYERQMKRIAQEALK